MLCRQSHPITCWLEPRETRKVADEVDQIPFILIFFHLASSPRRHSRKANAVVDSVEQSENFK